MITSVAWNHPYHPDSSGESAGHSTPRGGRQFLCGSGHMRDVVPALDLRGLAGRRADVAGGRPDQPARSRFCSMMCADQPAVRAQVNIAGIMCGGTSAKSRMTAAQNSTLVSIGRSGRRSRSSASAACSSACGGLVARGAELLAGAAQHPGARVLGAVDAVAEAHQPLVAVEDARDDLARRRRCARPPRSSAARGRARRRAAGRTSRRWRRTSRPRRRRRWRR